MEWVFKRKEMNVERRIGEKGEGREVIGDRKCEINKIALKSSKLKNSP